MLSRDYEEFVASLNQSGASVMGPKFGTVPVPTDEAESPEGTSA